MVYKAKKIIKKKYCNSKIFDILNKVIKNIVILRYHSIKEWPDEHDNLIGKAIIHSTSSFEKQMRFVAQYFNPITMVDIVECLDGKKEMPKKAIAVTFDDGYADNFYLAAPILNKFGIRATFYIISDCIGGGTLPWFVRLRNAFFTSGVRFWQEPNGGRVMRLCDYQERMQGFTWACRKCACLAGRQQEKYVEGVERSVAVDPPENSNIMLTREQLVSLFEMGHTIGCHTRSHPNLAYLKEETVKKELVESKRLLEKIIGSAVDHFSYPNPALHPNHNGMTTSCVAESGYLTAVTSSSGCVSNRENGLLLRRMHVPQIFDEFLWNLRWTALGRSL